MDLNEHRVARPNIATERLGCIKVKIIPVSSGSFQDSVVVRGYKYVGLEGQKGRVEARRLKLLHGVLAAVRKSGDLM